MLVERTVIVEVKAVETLTALHQAQLLTYLKLSGHKIGLLINFNARTIKQGLQRSSAMTTSVVSVRSVVYLSNVNRPVS